MVHKIQTAVTIGAGVLLVIGLLVLRRDVCNTTRFGPRAQRLIRIGLVVLACLAPSNSLNGCATKIVEQQSGLIANDADGSITKTRSWRSFRRVWEEASSIAADEKGPFPYTPDEKKDLMEGLADGVESADAYVKEGVLTPPEGELLKITIKEMMDDAGRFRTKGEERFTCYIPMIDLRTQNSMIRLKARIPFLEEMARTDRVQQAVLETVLQSMDDELAGLAADEKGSMRDSTGVHVAADVLAEAKKAINAVREKFGMTEVY